ncbi:MAG: L-seryl-tRNA(Sec) selenium transferase [Syntrophorhabdales bacterium]|jgi:L-seryl-tRNA(Ser) seleniumtransferase
MKDLLRKIPKVDDILRDDRWRALCGGFPEACAKDHLRDVLNELRAAIREGGTTDLPPVETIIGETRRRTAQSVRPALKKVINGTGIVIHTNLGRAPLARPAALQLLAVASGYSNIEYDLDRGKRGDRHGHCLALLKRLTGTEDALVVNNNAAAVLLALNTLAEGREVIIGRGELIEIGGSFRIPRVMEKSGTILREVGTTNRTFREDYERAIDEKTALIMKAHTSNYRIRGFVHETTSAELATLAAAHHIPFYFDAGSGLLSGPVGHIDASEPSVREEVGRCDVISFSGDKLLGGPQAGIILGRAPFIEAMKKNPLTRALRPDKLVLSALEATLLLYLDGDRAGREIPVLHMLTQDQGLLKRRAGRAARMVRKASPDVLVEVVPLESEVGGGSLPDVSLPSFGISLQPSLISVEEFEHRMRLLDIPVIGRIEKGRFLVDMRTVQEEDEAYLSFAILTALQHGR